MKKNTTGKPDKEALRKAEEFVRSALSVTSKKPVSEAKVKSVAKKVSQALPLSRVA
jgi:hypothetical protein